MPKLVEPTHEGKVTILRNQQVQIDRSIFDSKPDVVIHDNDNGIFTLIFVAILVDRNVIWEGDQILIYKAFKKEIQCKIKTHSSNTRGSENNLKIIQKNIWKAFRESKASKNCRKQLLYWELHPYFGKNLCRNTKKFNTRSSITCTTNWNS